MRQLTKPEQAYANQRYLAIDKARTILDEVLVSQTKWSSLGDDPEDLRVALARLEDWLDANAERWTL